MKNGNLTKRTVFHPWVPHRGPRPLCRGSPNEDYVSTMRRNTEALRLGLGACGLRDTPNGLGG